MVFESIKMELIRETESISKTSTRGAEEQKVEFCPRKREANHEKLAISRQKKCPVKTASLCCHGTEAELTSQFKFSRPHEGYFSSLTRHFLFFSFLFHPPVCELMAEEGYH